MTLNSTRLSAGVVSKFVPLIVMGVPGVTRVGENEVIVGGLESSPPLVIVKGVTLVAEPDGLVTVISPVVAPDGTTVVIRVDDAEVTEAVVPLKLTVLSPAVAPKAVP
jgi:hypothetical protein